MYTKDRNSAGTD